MFRLLTEASLLAHRESADGGRLAVQVEDKSVKIRNVKVRFFHIQLIMSCVILLLEGLGKLGVVCRCYLSQQDVYSLGSAFSCLMSLFIIERTHTQIGSHCPVTLCTPLLTATQLQQTSYTSRDSKQTRK